VRVSKALIIAADKKAQEKIKAGVKPKKIKKIQNTQVKTTTNKNLTIVQEASKEEDESATDLDIKMWREQFKY